MANGYIGKISAVVTANTSDLSRKLQGAVKDVDRFAQSLNRSVSASAQQATASLEKIFTPLQRLERRLQTALRFNIRTAAEVREIQSLTQAAEQLNKPLDRLQQGFTGLSLDIQSKFAPALRRAQDQAVAVNETITRTGAIAVQQFRAAEQAVNSTSTALQRLSELQKQARSGLTGRELQFSSPAALKALQDATAASQRAGALSPEALADGGIARQVQRLQTFRDAIARAAAEVEELRLRPNVDLTLLSAAEKRLNNIIATTAKAQRQLDTAVADAQGLFTVTNARPASAGLGLFGTQAGTAEQRALAKARELSAEFAKLPESAQQGLSGLAGIAANLANRVDQGKASAEQLEVVLERLRKRVEEASPAAALARANARLTIAPDQPPPPSPSTPLGNRNAQQGAERIRGLTGNLNIDSTPVPGVFNQQAQRDIDALASRVGQVRQQLETLPNSVRTRFIPELQRAAERLARLQNSPAATVQQIERAAKAVVRLEQNARRAGDALDFQASFGGRGVQGLNLGIDSRVLRGVGAEIEFVQSRLSNLGTEARGPVLVALERLRQTAASLFSGGTIDTSRGRRELELLRQEVVRTLSVAGGGKQNVLADQIRRVGDVGRGGFDKYSLAVQQAAFAVDDFLSVQGDLSQRIRAVQNNVTQLAFILGGTKGLLIGLGAAITAQVVIGLINFINNSTKAQDATKALNDALSRQKSLVEELRQAFESLGDTIARRAFSGPAQEAREFAGELGEITRKQKELRESRVADLDAAVQGERGFQNSLERRLENERDPGRRVVLQRGLQDSRRREEEALARATSASPTGNQVAAAIAEAVLSRSDFREDRAGARAAVEAVDRGTGVDAIQSQRAAIRRELDALQSSFPIRVGRQDAVNAAAELQRLLNALELPLTAALDDLSNQIRRAAFSAAVEIEGAQGDVADAIRRGVQGAGDFQAALDNTARQLAEAQAKVAAAQEIRDPGRREVEVRLAEGRVGLIMGQIKAINERAREVRLGRSFGGERTTAALSGLSGERFINEEAGLRARLRAAIDAEEQARRSVEAATRRGNEAARRRAIADLKAAQAASDLTAAAAEAAIALEQAFARIRKTAENIVSQSESLADDAQRRLDEQDPGGPRGGDRDVLRRERDDAERQLIQDRRREQELQNRLDRERAQAASNPAVAAIDQRLEQLRGQREDAAARGRVNRLREDPAVAERRENEIAGLEAKRAEIIRQQTAATQALIDKENQLVAARRRAAEQAQKDRDFDEELARRRGRRDADAIRGLDLIEAPGQKAGRELAEQIQDINAAFDGIVANLKGDAFANEKRLKAEADADAAVALARENAFRQEAPAIFGLADQVQNAILQGPSRAALEATDVSTVEGARELNRLLRGDDAARNQDLVQLQREANRLLQLIAEGGADIAN